LAGSARAGNPDGQVSAVTVVTAMTSKADYFKRMTVVTAATANHGTFAVV
jgi:hypothetical protein